MTAELYGKRSLEINLQDIRQANRLSVSTASTATIIRAENQNVIGIIHRAAAKMVERETVPDQQKHIQMGPLNLAPLTRDLRSRVLFALAEHKHRLGVKKPDLGYGLVGAVHRPEDDDMPADHPTEVGLPEEELLVGEFLEFVAHALPLYLFEFFANR